MKKDASIEEISENGIALFVLLYGGKGGSNLSTMRYNQYMKMTSGSNKVNPSKLPPSERAAHFHSLRVYFQVNNLFCFFV